MASYKLSNEAALDIGRILEFGIDNFGLDQAIHYHDSLQARLTKKNRTPLYLTNKLASLVFPCR